MTFDINSVLSGASQVAQLHTIRIYNASGQYQTIDAGYDPITARKLFDMVGNLSNLRALKETVVRAELWEGEAEVARENMPVRLDDVI